MDKGLPSVVVRTLVFIYQQQTAWIKWGEARSAQFELGNGTRQGSVLSPCFFAIYIDDLLKELRRRLLNYDIDDDDDEMQGCILNKGCVVLTKTCLN